MGKRSVVFWVSTIAIALGLRSLIAIQQPALLLTANPLTVQQGQSATLTTSVTVNGPLSTYVVPHNDVVTPYVTTTYTAGIQGTSATASVTVTVVPAPPPPAAAWSAICDTTQSGSSCGQSFPSGRGYNFALPFDAGSGEFVLFAGCSQDNTIYSNCLWGVNARTKTTRLLHRVDTHGAYGCYDTTQAPIVGHPIGLQWIQNGVWYAEGQLCSGYNAAMTSRMDLTSHAMLPPIPKWQYSVLYGGAFASCDGTVNQCGNIAWENGAMYVENYGKAIVGLNADQYGHHVVEFDGATYSDVTDFLKGADGITCANNSQQCPQPSYMHGAHFMSDGSKVVIFGGFDNPGNQFTNVYEYDPPSHTFSRIDPADGIKPPNTHSAIPMVALDTNRNRLVFYANDDELWQFSRATRKWTSFVAGGHGPKINGLDPIAWGSGDVCGFDPVQDAVTCVYSRGQYIAEGIFVLQFSGS